MKAFHGRGHDGSFDRGLILSQCASARVNALPNRASPSRRVTSRHIEHGVVGLRRRPKHCLQRAACSCAKGFVDSTQLDGKSALCGIRHKAERSSGAAERVRAFLLVMASLPPERQVFGREVSRFAGYIFAHRDHCFEFIDTIESIAGSQGLVLLRRRVSWGGAAVMHPSALDNGRLFFQTYVHKACRVLEIGAQDVNGSLRQLAPPGCDYVGVDFVAGPGVDVVLEDPYSLPFADGSADVVVSSSCFEHVEFFWLMFNEVLRVLRPAGLFYLNAPSNGDYHRYPVDCWRFYPDAAMALLRWGQRSGYRPALLESFTTYQRLDVWNDSVAVFVKDEGHATLHPARMLGRVGRYMNGRLLGCDDILCPQAVSEDGQKLTRLTGHSKPRE